MTSGSKAQASQGWVWGCPGLRAAGWPVPTPQGQGPGECSSVAGRSPRPVPCGQGGPLSPSLPFSVRDDWEVGRGMTAAAAPPPGGCEGLVSGDSALGHTGLGVAAAAMQLIPAMTAGTAPKPRQGSQLCQPQPGPPPHSAPAGPWRGKGARGWCFCGGCGVCTRAPAPPEARRGCPGLWGRVLSLAPLSSQPWVSEQGGASQPLPSFLSRDGN